MQRRFRQTPLSISIFCMALASLVGIEPPQALGGTPPLPLPVVPVSPKEKASIEAPTAKATQAEKPPAPAQAPVLPQSAPPAAPPSSTPEPIPSSAPLPGLPGQLSVPVPLEPISDVPDEPVADEPVPVKPIPASLEPEEPPPPPALPVQSYAGFGARSISPEIIQAFAPRPLTQPADLQRLARIERLLELHAPDPGIPSRDGTRYYFTWRVTGTAQVWRMDGPGTFPVQLTGGADATTLVSLTPDGRFLVISRDAKGEENPGLYLLPVEGGPLVPILHTPGVQVFLQRISDDSRTLWYKANDQALERYTLYCYDLATGMREQVFDHEGLWNLDDLHPDGRMLLRLERGSYWSEYWEYRQDTGALTPLFGQAGRNEYQAVYAPSGEGLLVASPLEGEFRHLFRWKEGTFTDLTPDLTWDVAGFGLDRAKQRLYLSVNENGLSRLRVWDASSLTPVVGPKLPEADQQSAGASSPDGRYTVFSVSSTRQPSQSFLWDWQTLELSPWTRPSAPELSLETFVPAVLEHYPARDGTAIPMWVRRPAGCEAGGCPVVVVFHGGPEGQSRPGFHPTAQLFVEAGFVYVEPNVRGSTGYGRAWRDADNGPKRLAVITDIEDAALYIRSSWGKDGLPPKVGVMGGSYGGYSTLMAMTRFAGAYDAGIAKVGMSNLVTFLENTAPYRRILRATEYGDPATDREALQALSPISWLDRLRDPLLIVQGVSDPRVPVGEALQMHDAAKARGTPVELILFGDEGHGVQKRSNRAIDLGHTLRFFEQHLKPGTKMSLQR